MIAAALMDPSTKDETFITDYLDRKVKTKEVFLTELFVNLNLNDQFDEVSNDNADPEPIIEEGIDILEYLREEENPKNLENEIEKYLNEAKPNYEEVLTWWKDNSSKYKRLSYVAKKFLSIPAMSSSIESKFSIAGLIVSARRSSLSTTKTEMLMYLHQNMDLIEDSI